MLLTNVQHFDRRDYQTIEEAVNFLKSTDFSVMALGRHEINDQFYIQVLTYDTAPITEYEFEIHRHRFDIHYLVSGQELIQVSPNPSTATHYNPERDLETVKTPATYSSLVLNQGDMLMIGMNEPHRTNGLVEQTVPVKKVVLKMRY